jgi:hypothetical protein
VTLPAGDVVVDARTSSGLRGRATAVIGPDPEAPIELRLR